MQKAKKVQFIEPYRSKELSDVNTDINGFQEYNSEHLLQFKSPRPTQSFTEFNTRLEPKVSSQVDDDIELDDNGESVASKREMFQKFQKFDIFLIKNRDRIEKRQIAQNNQVGSHENNGSLVYDQNTNRAILQQPSFTDSPAFPGLKDIRIDFNKVASNIPSNQLQDILNNNNNSNTNNNTNVQLNTNIDIQSNMNSGRYILLNGFNPSIDSMNNGENFSFFQNKLGRRKGKAMTLAQTQNIVGLNPNGNNFVKNLDAMRVGARSVQDVILRLSIRSSLMVYKFIRMLKKRVRLNVLQDLSQQQLTLINDLSHYYSSDNKKNKSRVAKAITNIIRHKILFVFTGIWKYCRSQLERCLSCIWQSKPIDPTSNWMVVWLIIQFVFILVAIFYTPLELINGDAFDIKYGRPWILYKYVNMIAFFLDIFLKFNTGLFEKGQIVMNRKEIVRSYFRGNFVLDLLAITPITQTLLQIDYLRPINLLILLKVQTARRILTQIQEMISQKNNKVVHALSLLQLLLMICSVCHIFACLFMGIAVLEENNRFTTTNWMEKQGIDGDDVHWFVKYNSALYFAVTTMITVGYGDIAPVTTYEIFFVTIAMFVSCGVFAYSFNQIGDLVREQNRMSNEFKNEMVLVNRLLEKKKINRDLKLQVRKFLEYRFYAEPQLSMEEERMVMGKLSHHLREKVILESNLQIINQCTLLTNNFSKKFLETLALRMNEIRVSKNEIIFEQNDFDDDPSLFIIDKGNIEIFIETDKQESDITILQILNQGSYFGEMNFFKEGLRSASARASDFTIIYGIPKSQFLSTVADFPLDFEQYCYMKDSLIYDNKIKVIDVRCFVCGKEDHLSRNCHLIHFVADKEKVILSDNYSTKQQRKHHLRKDYKQNSIKQLQEINEIQNYYMNQEINVNYIIINYQFLNEEPSLTEENAQVDLTHNTSNIGGVLRDNNNNNNNNPYAYQTNYNNFINNGNNNNMNNNHGLNRGGNDKPTTILPDIKRYVSNVYTSGGSILEQINLNKGDLSRNDNSDIDSPKSNEKQNNFNNYPHHTNQLSTVNTYNNNNYQPPSHLSKQYQGRFGQQASSFQQQQYTQHNFLNVNNYPKKKSVIRKHAGGLQYGNQDYDDDGHSTSFINNQIPQSSQNYGMLQQLMAILQKAMAPQSGNNNPNQGYSQNNINSFSHLPNFGIGGGGVSGHNPTSIIKSRGTYLNSHNKMFTNESEDINGWMYGHNNSRNRANTRNQSFLNKKREKEMMLQQMQFNNQMFLDGATNNVDISAYFEKSKIYTVYYPQHNVNIILKAIENTSLKQLKQPDYFSVYSFCIRPLPKKKDSSIKDINLTQVQQQHTNHGKSPQMIINLNGNAMQQSTIVFNKSYTFNQSFQLRHKGSVNLTSNPPKILKDTDSFKQKKNSIKPYNSLNHLKASTLRADSIVLGLNPLNSNDKHPNKSNFGQINNALECASIYQEKEKSYYPRFIFKKLFTLS